MKFTALGFVVLGVVGVFLATNEKTGTAVIFILLAMILLLLLANYKQVSGVLFTKG